MPASPSAVLRRYREALRGAVRTAARGDTETTTDLLVALTPLWWAGALAFYGVGDLVTTLVGLHAATTAEAGPIGALLVAEFGPLVMAPLKVVLLSAFYGLWVLTPSPHDVGIPLALFAVGVLVTAWNGVVLLQVALA